MKLGWECGQKAVPHLPLPQTCTALLLMLPNIMRKINLHRNLILTLNCVLKSQADGQTSNCPPPLSYLC